MRTCIYFRATYHTYLLIGKRHSAITVNNRHIFVLYKCLTGLLSPWQDSSCDCIDPEINLYIILDPSKCSRTIVCSHMWQQHSGEAIIISIQHYDHYWLSNKQRFKNIKTDKKKVVVHVEFLWLPVLHAPTASLLHYYLKPHLFYHIHSRCSYITFRNLIGLYPQCRIINCIQCHSDLMVKLVLHTIVVHDSQPATEAFSNQCKLRGYRKLMNFISSFKYQECNQNSNTFVWV